jgi:hypothetical protein
MQVAAKARLAHLLGELHDVGAPPMVIFLAGLDALLEFGARHAPKLAEAAIYNRFGQEDTDARR